jgi:hypothetical protein
MDISSKQISVRIIANCSRKISIRLSRGDLRPKNNSDHWALKTS